MAALTAHQRITLSAIENSSVYECRFGYGAWRIQGGVPGTVGKLVKAGLAAWQASVDDRRDCVLTTAGRDALSKSEAL